MSSDEKEIAMQELWRRLALTSGISRPPVRNPTGPPSDDAYPTVNFFDMDGEVIDVRSGGRVRMPIYMWDAQIIIEPFIYATDEDSATDELANFVKLVKKEIYRGGMTLGGKCKEIVEIKYSQLLRPTALITGISLTFGLKYIENVSNLY